MTPAGGDTTIVPENHGLSRGMHRQRPKRAAPSGLQRDGWGTRHPCHRQSVTLRPRI